MKNVYLSAAIIGAVIPLALFAEHFAASGYDLGNVRRRGIRQSGSVGLCGRRIDFVAGVPGVDRHAPSGRTRAVAVRRIELRHRIVVCVAGLPLRLRAP